METAAWAQVIATVVGVAVGVGLAEWGARVRGRRQRLEQLVGESSQVVPHVTLALLARGHDAEQIDTGYGSLWAERHEKTTALLAEIRSLARWPMRRAPDIRLETDDLAARLTAAWLRATKDRRLLTWEEYLHVTTLPLRRVVFNDVDALDDAVKRYRQGGLDSDRRLVETA